VWIQQLGRVFAEAALLEGQPEEALSRLTEPEGEHGRREDTGSLWTLAWAQADLGNLEEAQEAASAAAAAARESKGQFALVEALIVQGMVASRMERWEEAETTLRDAISRARRIAFPFGEARALGELGGMFARAGASGEARVSLEEALGIFRRLGAMKDAE